MQADKKEILRYLGYRGKPADEKVLTLIESCLSELGRVARPKSTWAWFDAAVTEQQVSFGGLTIKSRKLASHLHGCDRAMVFAATLGLEVDRLMARYERLDMSRAVVMQASAAALVEDYCNECCEHLAQEAAKQGYFLRPRFSPGYADFSIQYQRALLHLLDTAKKIGLSMTESCMLVPVKSVTAVIGLTREQGPCEQHKCSVCEKKDCPFREE